MNRIRRPWAWAIVFIAVLTAAVLGRPALHLTLTSLNDRRDRPDPPPGHLDDASGLSQTRVAEVWDIPADSRAAEEQLVVLVRRAHSKSLPISIAGARHSMGGHSLAPDGIVINMLPFHEMELDEDSDILKVQAGALWSDVIPFLNAKGRSVAVMQSNNSFTVGGSISVNCHGWQANRPPIASTVASLRLLQADGSIVRCSRKETPELFSLVLGGYGLFGVILDVELRVVPNEAYHLERLVLPTDRFAATFANRVTNGKDVGMAYGRLSVAPEAFLTEAILTVFHRDASHPARASRVDFPEFEGLTRAMVRGQVGSDYGKSLRWRAEKHLAGALFNGSIYRNQLLNEPVEVFENRAAANTDVLHEYFVPPDAFLPFVNQMRAIVPRHRGDLLNLTVRGVLRDADTYLRYADRDMLALVLLFNQPRTPAGDTVMAEMTRELIDAAIRLGGRYYLPYRLHASPDQLRAAYPEASEFFERKRRYDPDELFQNSFYRRYATGKPSDSGKSHTP